MFPAGIKYSKDHIWVRMEGDIATIGITDFAQQELGDIVYVEVETENQHLNKEAIFGTIEAVKTVTDLFLPFDAQIINFNTKLEDEPELVNTDPYQKGWIVTAKVKNPADVETLLDAEDYKRMLNL